MYMPGRGLRALLHQASLEQAAYPPAMALLKVYMIFTLVSLL